MLQKQLRRLEDEINDCEARVKLHDGRLSGELRAARSGVTHVLGSKAVLAGGAVLGSLAGLWWTRSRRHSHTNASHAGYREGYRDGLHAAHRRGGGAGAAELLQRWSPLLVPLLTPMLDRKVALFLSGLGLPVALKPLQPLPTVTQLDLTRYAGKWHEIARLPQRHEKQCRFNVTAEYKPDDDGGFTVVNRCVRDDGRVDEAEGKARIPDAEQPGQLEVSFAPSALRWYPGAWGDYWVLFVDEDYSVSLVGTPDRDGLWILSRSTTLPATDLEALKSLAERHGFNTDRLVSTPQDAAHDQPDRANAAKPASAAEGAHDHRIGVPGAPAHTDGASGLNGSHHLHQRG